MFNINKVWPQTTDELFYDVPFYPLIYLKLQKLVREDKYAFSVDDSTDFEASIFEV